MSAPAQKSHTVLTHLRISQCKTVFPCSCNGSSPQYYASWREQVKHATCTYSILELPQTLSPCTASFFDMWHAIPAKLDNKKKKIVVRHNLCLQMLWKIEETTTVAARWTSSHSALDPSLHVFMSPTLIRCRDVNMYTI